VFFHYDDGAFGVKLREGLRRVTKPEAEDDEYGRRSFIYERGFREAPAFFRRIALGMDVQFFNLQGRLAGRACFNTNIFGCKAFITALQLINEAGVTLAEYFAVYFPAGLILQINLQKRVNELHKL